LHCQFLIDEGALRYSGMPRTIMDYQLRHLLARRSNIEIRILPLSAGPIRLCSPPFALFRFEEQEPAVCVSNLNSLFVLEDREIVTGYRSTLSKLMNAALTVQRSRELLNALVQNDNWGNSGG
jgi:hypothetical protein